MFHGQESRVSSKPRRRQFLLDSGMACDLKSTLIITSKDVTSLIIFLPNKVPWSQLHKVRLCWTGTSLPSLYYIIAPRNTLCNWYFLLNGHHETYMTSASSGWPSSLSVSGYYWRFWPAIQQSINNHDCSSIYWEHGSSAGYRNRISMPAGRTSWWPTFNCIKSSPPGFESLIKRWSFFIDEKEEILTVSTGFIVLNLNNRYRILMQRDWHGHYFLFTRNLKTFEKSELIIVKEILHLCISVIRTRKTCFIKAFRRLKAGCNSVQ